MNKREYIEKHGEEVWRKLLEQRKEYYKANSERIKKRANEYAKKNKEKRAKKHQEWRLEHIEERRDYHKQYHAIHREERNESSRKYHSEHREESNIRSKGWYKGNPEKVEENRKKQRKGGIYYEKKLRADQTGLRGERNRIRKKHAKRWRKYKGNWLTETQIHHEWIEGTAEYQGIAIVDKMEHQYGIINPIVILEGVVVIRPSAFV